jgi:4-amino-4-deoxy-L-arabinose transferase-like glycosyltransferase
MAVTAAAVFLLWGMWSLPMTMWDESRNIVNALEMWNRGYSLVTTYGGLPDLWNTKPPLLIWTMVASLDAFGPSLFSLRLPNAVMMIGTLWITFGLAFDVTRSKFVAASAVALIALSPALFAQHGARTADYEPMLMFFVTAYLTLFYRTIHWRLTSGRDGVLLTILVTGALLTKSIAGVTPMAGILVYIIITRRWSRVRSRHVLIFAALAVAAMATVFLVMREQAAPGYFAATWHNDVAGRFGSQLSKQGQSWWFYLHFVARGRFAGIALLFLLPLVWQRFSNRERLLVTYCLTNAGSLLVLVSIASTRFLHYLLPALPFFAIAVAVTVRRALPVLLRPTSLHVRLAVILATLILLATIGGGFLRLRAPQERPSDRRYTLYDPFVRQVAAHDARPLLLIDPGRVSDGGSYYDPILYANRIMWRARGLITYRTISLANAERHDGPIVSCYAPASALLLQRGRVLASDPSCAAIIARSACTPQ